MLHCDQRYPAWHHDCTNLLHALLSRQKQAAKCGKTPQTKTSQEPPKVESCPVNAIKRLIRPATDAEIQQVEVKVRRRFVLETSMFNDVESCVLARVGMRFGAVPDSKWNEHGFKRATGWPASLLASSPCSRVSLTASSRQMCVPPAFRGRVASMNTLF